MAGIRLQIDLFIPAEIYDGIPSAKKLAFRNGIRELKALSIDVNNEDTTRAVWHRCYHDTGDQLCEEENEI